MKTARRSARQALLAVLLFAVSPVIVPPAIAPAPIAQIVSAPMAQAFEFMLSSDSTTSTRYYGRAGLPGASPGQKIAAAIGATLLRETSPYSIDGASSAQSLARLQTAYSNGELANVQVLQIGPIGANDIWHGTAWSVTLANIAGHVTIAKQANIPIILVASEATQLGDGTTIPADLPTRDRLTRLADLQALVASASVGYAGKIAYVGIFERLVVEAVKRQNIAAPVLLFKDPPDLSHPNHSDTAVDGGDVIAEEVLKVFVTLTAPTGFVWNSAQPATNLNYSPDNLTLTQPANELGGSAIATVGISSGKGCFELEYLTPIAPTSAMIGFTYGAYTKITSLATTPADAFWYDSSGRRNTNGYPAEASGGTTWTSAGDIAMACVDAATGKIFFKGPNGAWLSAADDAAVAAGNGADFVGGSGRTWSPIAGILSGAEVGNAVRANFAGPFHHSMPSGFSAIAN